VLGVLSVERNRFPCENGRLSVPLHLIVRCVLEEFDVTIHVYPIEDWIEHQIDCEASECSCLCDFRVEYFDDDGTTLPEPIVVHEAIDGRE
jgi:hypothetical protein